MNIDSDYDEIYFEDVDKKIELERDFIFKLDSSDKDNKIVEISKSTELYIDTFIDKINDMYNRKVIEWSNNNIENDTCSIDICINDIKLLDKIRFRSSYSDSDGITLNKYISTMNMTDKIEKESTNHGYVESLPCVYINKMSMIVNIQTVKRKLHKDKKYVNIVLLCKTSDFSGMNWRRR